MSGEADTEDAASALEILRQAQAVILAQTDAMKGIESKSVSLLQATLSLATGSLGGAAVSLGAKPDSVAAIIPTAAGIGLAVSGACFVAAAIRAALALRPTNFAVSAIRPAELFAAGYEKQPARQVYLAIAFELDTAITTNDALGRKAATRFEVALFIALAAPFVGGLAAMGAASEPLMKVAAGVAAGGALFWALGQITAWALRRALGRD